MRRLRKPTKTSRTLLMYDDPPTLIWLCQAFAAYYRVDEGTILVLIFAIYGNCAWEGIPS